MESTGSTFLCNTAGVKSNSVVPTVHLDLWGSFFWLVSEVAKQQNIPDLSASVISSHVSSYDSIDTGESPVSGGPAAAMDQPHVIPSQGDLLGDLLNLDLGPPVNVPQVSSMQMGAVDLLGGGLDSLVSLNTPTHTHAHSAGYTELKTSSGYDVNFSPVSKRHHMTAQHIYSFK